MSEFPAEPERLRAWRHRAPRPRPFLPSPPRLPQRSLRELPVELAAFEGIVDPALLESAARRAERLGVGGDEVLRCFGILTPDQIADGIAELLGIEFDPLDEEFKPRALAAACAGALSRREDGGESTITVAARSTGIR